MNNWFRSWHGAPTDNKWLVIGSKAGVPPGIVSAIVWALLDYASQRTDSRGSVEGFDIETYSVFSGFSEQQIGAVIKALQDKGLLEESRFKSWNQRQPVREDQGAAERKRKQREKEDQKDDVTQCHATSHDVTTDKIREEKNREEKKDTPQPPKGPDIPDWMPKGEWENYLDHRKALKIKTTPRALQLAITELDKLRKRGHDPAAVINQSILQGWKGLFELKGKQPVTRDQTEDQDYMENLAKRMEAQRAV